jgi:hypothetical protein
MSSRDLQLQLHDFLEHLMICSTNSTKFFRTGAVPNRALDAYACVLIAFNLIYKVLVLHGLYPISVYIFGPSTIILNIV